MNKREKESSDLQILGERIDKKYAEKRLEVDERNKHIKRESESGCKMKFKKVILPGIGFLAGLFLKSRL